MLDLLFVGLFQAAAGAPQAPAPETAASEQSGAGVSATPDTPAAPPADAANTATPPTPPAVTDPNDRGLICVTAESTGSYTRRRVCTTRAQREAEAERQRRRAEREAARHQRSGD